MDIEKIVGSCGGVNYLAFKFQLREYTILLWKKNGIPEKYWKRLIKLNKELTVVDLHNANERARNR